MLRNQGFISVGTRKDISVLAVDTIRWWWLHFGRQADPHAEEILIVADGGDSNGYRTRLWKQQLRMKEARVNPEWNYTIAPTK